MIDYYNFINKDKLRNTRKKGISLITLVITIIVVIILVAAVIIGLKNSGLNDKSTKAKFMNNYRSVQEGVMLYQSSHVLDSASLKLNSLESIIPTDDGKLTLQDKETILTKVPTLAAKIMELNPDKASLDEVDLYWVDENKIGASKIPAGKENGYIIDADTNQLYDYNGSYFDNLRWHTLDGGLPSDATPTTNEEIWDGWIKLTLYYPKGSINRQWRLGEEGEKRDDQMLNWQNYTGAITIPLSRIKDVWIRYYVNGKSNTIPPAGTLLVDIEPDIVYPTMTDKVNVKITYADDAETKEYRIGNSGWMTYNGPFTVTQNCIIDARAQKTEKIYNSDGSLQLERPIMGKDTYVIKNIKSQSPGQNDSSTPNILIAPTIKVLDARNSDEKADVQIVYPSLAAKKCYVIDNGQEQEYTNDISITKFDTKVVAYYYDKDGNKSSISEITIKKDMLALPNLKICAPRDDKELASVEAMFPSNAVKKYVKIDNGKYQEYTNAVSITKWDTTVTVYYTDIKGNLSGEVSITVPKPNNNAQGGSQSSDNPSDPDYLPAPNIIKHGARNGNEIANVEVKYPDKAVKKCYRIDTVTSDGNYYIRNIGIEQTYSDLLSITNSNVYVVAYYYDKDGKKSQESSVYIENLEAPNITRKDARNSNEVASVHVDYPKNAVTNIYDINYGEKTIYQDDISIAQYGSVVEAYYYDADGVRSAKSAITINEVKNDTPAQQPTKDDPAKNEDIPTPPEDEPLAPVITESPTTTTTSVQVTLSGIPSDAEETKIKVGKNGEYVDYTGAVTIKDNTDIYAYYRTSKGEKSKVAFKQITNIQPKSDDPNNSGRKPYLVINANPYPYKGSEKTTSVNVSIVSSDADTVEYSTDGVIYTSYTKAFDVTQNIRIYARATNANGTTIQYLDIDNIESGDGKIDPPVKEKNIPIEITATPDPKSSTDKVTKVTVTINYGADAKEKYYSFGENDKQQTYTNSFEVTKNCTVYAYAKGDNAVGEASLKIDNLLDGISKPIITTNPSDNKTASKVKISIEYDKYATAKQYSINGGELQNYTQPFEIDENNTAIYAVNTNAKGDKADTTYVIKNIIPDPPVVILDKGDYYIIHLNYPEIAKTKEYKWKKDGTWKTYNDNGILLVKPQAKDKIIKGSVVKVQDDTGKTIDYSNDYYLLDVPISKLNENLFMRWDMTDPTIPIITPSTKEPAKNITVSIEYEQGSTQMQYKKVLPGQTYDDVKWTKYTEAIPVDSQGTIIYARSEDENEMWSKDAIYVVNNIDDKGPDIKLSGDFEKAARVLEIMVNATDDSGVNGIRYQKGQLGESYFTNDGISITNGSTIDIIENGIYTFYADDVVGNKQILTLTVTNIDRTAPNAPTISVNQTNWTNQNVEVTITYPEDADKKLYSTNGTIWKDYTDKLSIDSNMTIYAKSEDVAGNDSTVATLTIGNIDKVAPNISNMEVIDNTSTSVKIKINAIDDKSGIKKYYYKLENNAWVETLDSTIYIKDLKNGTNYNLYVKVEDNCSNISTVQSTVISTLNLKAPTFKYDGLSSDWKNGIQKLTIDYLDASRLIKKYSYDEKNWIEVNNDEIILDIDKNCKVYALVEDSEGGISESNYNISNVDNIAPLINSISVVSYTDVSVTLNPNTTENDSGIKKYLYSFDNQNYNDCIKENNYIVIDKLEPSTGYLVYIKAMDNAGNLSESYSINFKTKEIAVYQKYNTSINHNLGSTSSYYYGYLYNGYKDIYSTIQCAHGVSFYVMTYHPLSSNYAIYYSYYSACTTTKGSYICDENHKSDEGYPDDGYKDGYWWTKKQ